MVRSLITVGMGSLRQDARGGGLEVDELAGLEEARVLDAVRGGDALPITSAVAAAAAAATAAARLRSGHRLQVRVLLRLRLRRGAGRALEAGRLGDVLVVEGEGGDLLLRERDGHRRAQRTAFGGEELERFFES